MPVEMSRINKVLGDRALVRKLGKPQKKGGLYIPESAVNKNKQSEIWYGVIEHLGKGMKYADAYGLSVGDLVGIEFTGSHSETFEGDDREQHAWVPEEFFTCKDSGRAKEFFAGNDYGDAVGLTPIGQYVIVEPDAEDDYRNGIRIPESARGLQRTGRVVAVSGGEVSGSELYPLDIKVGAEILFGRYSGSWLKLGKKEFLIMKHEDIISELKPKEVAANV